MVQIKTWHRRAVETKPVLRAAQYVRMSTDRQCYSIDNQAHVIGQFAQSRGIEIVRTYADAGRSGVTLAKREALQQLLADVQEGRAGFNVLLVYDVSRWGRFQDIDESAHYEFVCRRAGVRVVYCAEPFENDGSTYANVLKSLKRAMAGEYSRELSSKTFLGSSRLAARGYRQGGTAGVGLRRLLLDADGAPRMLLNEGEQKCIATDRVVLIPGPRDEQRLIRLAYWLFVRKGWGQAAIARYLNSLPKPIAMPDLVWDAQRVSQLLAAEKYCGTNVYGRVSVKLGTRPVRNPRAAWVVVEDAFEAVVPKRYSIAARDRIAGRIRELTDEDALDALRALWKRQGHLSSRVIGHSPEAASVAAYVARFGSLREAYRRIGYEPKSPLVGVRDPGGHRALRDQFAVGLLDEWRQAGADAHRLPRHLYSVDGIVVGIRLLRRSVGPDRGPHWKARHPTYARPVRAIVLARLEADHQTIRDYFVLPPGEIDLPRLPALTETATGLEQFRSRGRSELLSRIRAIAGRGPGGAGD